jgi:hypothetical protein
VTAFLWQFIKTIAGLRPATLVVVDLSNKFLKVLLRNTFKNLLVWV